MKKLFFCNENGNIIINNLKKLNINIKKKIIIIVKKTMIKVFELHHLSKTEDITDIEFIHFMNKQVIKYVLKILEKLNRKNIKKDILFDRTILPVMSNDCYNPKFKENLKNKNSKYYSLEREQVYKNSKYNPTINNIKPHIRKKTKEELRDDLEKKYSSLKNNISEYNGKDIPPCVDFKEEYQDDSNTNEMERIFNKLKQERSFENITMDDIPNDIFETIIN